MSYEIVAGTVQQSKQFSYVNRFRTAKRPLETEIFKNQRQNRRAWSVAPDQVQVAVAGCRRRKQEKYEKNR